MREDVKTGIYWRWRQVRKGRSIEWRPPVMCPRYTVCEVEGVSYIVPPGPHAIDRIFKASRYWTPQVLKALEVRTRDSPVAERLEVLRLIRHAQKEAVAA